MERELLHKYLKFLAERAESLVTKDIVEDYDVAMLKRELRDFKSRIETSTGSALIDESIAALEVRASEKDADGDQAGFLKVSMKLLFGRGAAWQEVDRRRQLKVKNAIAAFRDDLSRVHFSLKV